MSASPSILKVFRSYGISVRRFRLAFLSVLATYGIASILGGILSPLVYRHIIDIISQGGSGDRVLLASQLFDSLFVLIGVIIAYQVLYRVGDFTISYAESKTMEDLNNRAFQAFMRQGHGFFC